MADEEVPPLDAALANLSYVRGRLVDMIDEVDAIVEGMWLATGTVASPWLRGLFFV